MIKLKDILEGTRCWKGYTKKGMKTMFGKRVPNCVKNEAELPKDGFSDKEQMIMYDDVEENVATDHDGKAAPYGSGYDEVEENFADGKKPGRKGISKRVGIPKKATLTQLAKLAKAKGEKGRMARWQLNMRRGKKKKKSS